MSNFIVLETAWTTPWGYTFPADTLFFRRQTRSGITRYDYDTPAGGEGQIILNHGQNPGDGAELTLDLTAGD